MLTLSYDNKARFSYDWGYRFYGMLMEQLDINYVESLHGQKLTPITQYVSKVWNENCVRWTINLLDDLAVGNITKLIDRLQILHMKNNNMDFKVEEKDLLLDLTEKEFVQQSKLINYEDRTYKLRFITPTSFKSNKEYVFFPTPELIIKSLLSKWNNFSNEIIIDDEYVMNTIISGTRITSYNLRSHYYTIKSIKIPAFVGELALRVKMPLPILEIFNLLLSFACISGVGIKTSLGMGGVKLL